MRHSTSQNALMAKDPGFFVPARRALHPAQESTDNGYISIVYGSRIAPFGVLL
jgi:hypothetical protein